MAARRWPHFLGLDGIRGRRVVVVVVVVLGVVGGVDLVVVCVGCMSLNTIGLKALVDVAGATVVTEFGVMSKINSASGSKELSWLLNSCSSEEISNSRDRFELGWCAKSVGRIVPRACKELGTSGIWGVGGVEA